jgi:hypothetical protein
VTCDQRTQDREPKRKHTALDLGRKVLEVPCLKGDFPVGGPTETSFPNFSGKQENREAGHL